MIVKRLSNLIYQIQLNKSGTKKAVYHSNIKPYLGIKHLKWTNWAIGESSCETLNLLFSFSFFICETLYLMKRRVYMAQILNMNYNNWSIQHLLQSAVLCNAVAIGTAYKRDNAQIEYWCIRRIMLCESLKGIQAKKKGPILLWLCRKCFLVEKSAEGDVNEKQPNEMQAL